MRLTFAGSSFVAAESMIRPSSPTSPHCLQLPRVWLETEQIESCEHHKCADMTTGAVSWALAVLGV